jgi:protein gp37
MKWLYYREGETMPLKKSTGNMYSWVTHTWNPVKGECPYGCRYCYVDRWGKQPKLHLDEQEMKINLGMHNTIFVCSGCDLFHPDSPDGWIIDIIRKTMGFWDNTYLWHTKNPIRANNFLFPPNSILCATIESNIPWPGISKAPQPYERIDGLKEWPADKMITVEPVMDFDVMTFSEMILSCKPAQVNIGADSGRNNLPEPSREKVEELLDILGPHTKVHLKKNLRRILPESRHYEAP